MNIYLAKNELAKLRDKPKFDAMLKTASIVTQLLAKHNIKPIVVGGFSVEIYTREEYATRDIDFVSDGYDQIQSVLLDLGFKKDGRYFYHEDIEIAIEIPSNALAGDYNKVLTLKIDDQNYVYVISREDIILDRLRAGVHWKSEEDQIWAFKLLSTHYSELDLTYLRENTETKEELELLNEWLTQLERDV